MQAIVIALGYPPELDGKTSLLQILHPLVTLRNHISTDQETSWQVGFVKLGVVVGKVWWG